MKLKHIVEDDERKASDEDDINVFSEENPSFQYADKEEEEEEGQEIVPFCSSSSSTHDQDVKRAIFLKYKEDIDDNPLMEILSGEGKISVEEIPKVSSLSDKKEVKQIIGNEAAKSENTTPICEENLQKEEKTSPTNGDVKKDDVLNISPASQVLPVTARISFSRKKLLVLDLNGLLVDVGKKSFFKRPFCDDFLKFCFERFNVGVWSSRTKKNVDRVVDFVMGDLKWDLLFCWDLSHCTETGFRTMENRYKPLVLKELKTLWDKNEHRLPWEKGIYNESNTLLLDDSPYKALRNPLHTAIFPFSYTRKDTDDNSLGPGGDLQVYLEGLAVAENVQKYVEQHPFGQNPITNKHPSWDFYQHVVRSIAPKMNQQMDLSSIDLMKKWEHFKIK